MPQWNSECQRQAAARVCLERTVHGHGRRGMKSPTLGSYHAMITRCENESRAGYRNYGGRGIAICARWRESFMNFLEDMGERPEGTSLDRFPDGDGNYEPGNCRWATRQEQGQNTRRTIATPQIVAEIRHRHTNGESYSQLAIAFGLSKPTIGNIVTRSTWKNVR